MVEFAITQLKFSGGQTIEPERGSLIVLIGANSAGKSRALREISDQLWGRKPANHTTLKVVEDVGTHVSGNVSEWFKWLSDNFYYVVTPDGIEFRTIGATIREQYFELFFDESFRGTLGHFILRLLDTESRLTLTQPVQRTDTLDGNVQHEFHLLQLDDKELEIVNQEIFPTFNRKLIIDLGLATQLRLYAGHEPERTTDRHPSSSAYLAELRKQTPLELDGDGIRSYVSSLLATSLNPHKIFVIDEPEVFLHPPQARRLGKLLADTAQKKDRQIIIATHSSDIIKGALSSNGKVHICRIERSDEVNYAYNLSNEELRSAWNKPLLKSTDAIQGAFHRGVIVCEGDADCRFYESLLLRMESDSYFVEAPDLHFVHGGGKSELPTLAESYKKLFVPTAVIADFDILRSEGVLKKLISGLGGNLDEFQEPYKKVKNALKSVKPAKDLATASELLRRMADEIDQNQSLTGKKIESLVDLLKETQDWSLPKKLGVLALEGGANRDCKNLIAKLAKLGLFIVPNGELESWDKSLGSKSTPWINDALEEIERKPNSFQDAQIFVRDIANYLGVSSASASRRNTWPDGSA